MLSYEYRVVVKLPRMEPLETDVPNEHDAAEWAALEREDYPHAKVIIERREVGPWEPYEPCE